jgi:hypothetical protein
LTDKDSELQADVTVMPVATAQALDISGHRNRTVRKIMKKTTKAVLSGLSLAVILGTALSASADTYASPAAEERLLVQTLSDLRSAKGKLSRIERGYGGHVERARETVGSAIHNVEEALAHARAHHGHDDD